MDQDHPFFDDIPAYTLGALDLEEARSLEAHLQTCELCRKELTASQAASQNLLLGVTPRQPPPGLRRQIISKLPGNRKTWRVGFSWLSGQALLILLALALVALNFISLIQIHNLQQQQAGLLQKYQSGQAALALLSSPGTRNIPISSGEVSGSFLLDQNRNAAMIIIWNLPRLAENQTYQAWLIDSQGKRTSAAVFQPEAGQAFTATQISSSLALSNFKGLGVTVEPSGGSSQPTGQRIFKIDF